MSPRSAGGIDLLGEPVDVVLVVVDAEAHPPTVPAVVGDHTPGVEALVDLAGFRHTKGQEMATIGHAATGNEPADEAGVDLAQQPLLETQHMTVDLFDGDARLVEPGQDRLEAVQAGRVERGTGVALPARGVRHGARRLGESTETGEPTRVHGPGR